MSDRVKIKREEYDVVVVGGGLSGMCAAISAARHGARTALVHARHVLGGNASSEIRMHICGASENMAKPYLEEGGILYEMMLENKSINNYFSYAAWDRVLYSKVKEQKNLTVYLNTVMDDCTALDGKIKEISCYQHTTETRWNIGGRIFVDATGNGTLGYLSGAIYRTGSEGCDEFGEPHAPKTANNNRMGNTLLFKAVDRGESVNFRRPEFAKVFTEEQLKYRTHSALSAPKGGENDKYLQLASFGSAQIDYGYWWIELSGEKEDIIDEYEDIRDELVKCIYGVWDHLKNGGEHGAGNYDLEWVGMLPGMRESRRLVGDYLLNENDVLSNRRFEDAVAYGGWAMDIHTPRGLYDFDKQPTSVIPFEGAYTIPYRSYYSKNVDNLMMAGRIISATKMAMGSTRVMGTCAIGGQAVGTAASMCIKYGCMPRDILSRITELQQTLLKDDCYIPDLRNTDENDIALGARVCATSFKEGYVPTNVINGVSRPENGNENIWVSDGIGDDGETITLAFEKNIVSQVRVTFDPNFNFSIKQTMSVKRQSQQRRGVSPEIVKDFTVSLWLEGKEIAKKRVEGNFERLCTVDFDKTECDAVTLCIHSTNGDSDARVYEIRIY